MAQFFKGVEALLVGRDEIDRHLNWIAEMHLAQIANMCFCGERRSVTFFHVLRADPEFEPHLIDAAIEQHVVISHVEVAVVVDPLRFDLHHGGEERGCDMLRRIALRNRAGRHPNSRLA